MNYSTNNIARQLLLVAGMVIVSRQSIGSARLDTLFKPVAEEASGRQADVATKRAQEPKPNPFLPPAASMHYAPDRTCDLLNVAVDLDVDYPNLTCTGRVVNTMATLREGISAVTIQAGPALEIRKATVDGIEAKYTRQGHDLTIAIPHATKGKVIKVAVDYTLSQKRMDQFGADAGGWYWVPRDPKDAAHVGFWTTGEPNLNSNWCPTWDYPNDLATSETRTTVPANWDVIGNGVLVSNKPSKDRTRRTFDWKMTLPHATYLLSVSAGPFDIKRDRWEGIDLWYAVPRGRGQSIEANFGDTKDMLRFFSTLLGVKYPWSKYAQTAVIDGPAGMENVSSTTVGDYNLTNEREGLRRAAQVNSHELAHQWFGDLVNCKDWGDIWLNESFATYLQHLYFAHARGKNAFEQEQDQSLLNYLAESRQYKRPLSTKLYSTPDAMFSSHAYDKGALVLHTLRRQLGDAAFFGGLKLYLTTWRHTPVESAQLRRCMTEASGINCEPFWAQWIEKPGHPVLDYTWTPRAGGGVITVRQLQDTRDGTPTYDIYAKVGLIAPDGRFSERSIHLTKAEESFDIASAEPIAAVILDPDHDFLRQISKVHWSATELPLILCYAPNCQDRALAMSLLLKNAPSDATIQLITDQIRADKSRTPAFRSEWYAAAPAIAQLSKMARPELRSFWLECLTHPDFSRQAEAVNALGALPPEPETITRLRRLITAQAPIQVVVNAIQALAKWDKNTNSDVFQRAFLIESPNDVIRKAAAKALGK